MSDANGTATCLNLKYYNELQQVLTYHLLLLLGFPLAVIGVVTSILSFAMFSRDRVTPKTTRFMLKTVSLADTLFLILFILYIDVSTIGRKLNKVKLANGTSDLPFYMQKGYLIPVLVLIQTIEIFRNWITVLIGVERFIVVCIPLRAPQVCTKRRTVAVCVVLMFFAIIIRTPLLVRRILTTRRLRSGINLTEDEKRTFVLVDRLKTVHEILDTIFMLVIPLIILIFCTLRIVRALNKTSDCICANTNQHARDLHKRNVKVTWMLLAVIIVFGVCTIPYIIFTVSKFITTCHASIINRLILPILWFGTLVYSTTNFFVYVLFMRKYRQILWRMLRRRRDPCHSERTNDYTLVYRNSVPSVRR